MPSAEESEDTGLRLVHQKVSLEIDFREQELSGFTSLTLEANPMFPENVVLSCADQCAIQRVSVGEVDATYVLSGSFRVGIDERDPLKLRDRYNEYTEDSGNERLEITLPEDVKKKMNTKIVLTIHYSLRRPKAGLQFVQSPRDQSVYLYSQNQFEFTVPVEMVVVASAELVEQILSPDGATKVCSFRINIPVAAPNIGLAAGPFEVTQDSANEKLFYFCPHEYVEALDNSMSVIPNALESIKDYLTIPYPFESFKQVFVPVSSAAKIASCASLAIFSVDILNDETIIDQTFSTRMALVETLAEQWFGVCVYPKTLSDTWLIVGLSRYLAMQYLKRLFGQNEILYRLRAEADWVCEHDVEQPALADYISNPDETRVEFVRKKGLLILYTFERWVGKNEVSKMLTKILTSYQQDEMPQGLSQGWFIRTIKKQTTKDKEIKAIVDHYVNRPGCPIFKLNYMHNKKKNVVELIISQSSSSKILNEYKQKDETLLYMGSITIRIVEIEGFFDHVVNIDEPQHRFEFPIRSRNKRAKKKNELDSSFNVADDVEDEHSFETLHWVRLDPDDEWLLSSIFVNQNDASWRRQLQLDKDVLSQLQAIRGLRQRQSKQTIMVLLATMTDPRVYYRMQMEAALVIAGSANYINEYLGLTYLQQYFTFKYCLGGVSKNSIVYLPPAEDPATKNGAVLPSFIARLYDEGKAGPPSIGVPKPHDFSKFAEYFVERALIAGMALARDENGLPIPAVMKFLVGLLRYHDNLENPYSDAYYLNDVILTLGKCVQIPESMLLLEKDVAKRGSSIYFFTEALEEIYRYLDLDAETPSHHGLVTAACLEVLFSLQATLQIAFDLKLFLEYSQPHFHNNIRRVSLRALVKFGLSNVFIFKYLLHTIASDPSPDLRLFVAKLLSQAFSALNENHAVQKQIEALVAGVKEQSRRSQLFTGEELVHLINLVSSDRLLHQNLLTIYLQFLTVESGATEQSKTTKLSIKFSGVRRKRQVEEIEREGSPDVVQTTRPSTFAPEPPAAISLILKDKKEAVTVKAPSPSFEDENVDILDHELFDPMETSENEETSHWKQVLKKLMRHHHSHYFMDPPDKKFVPSYHQYIKQPIGLRMIAENLTSETKYKTADEFEADIRLIFSNCYRFNPTWDSFPVVARELEGFFNQLWGKGPPQIPVPRPPTAESVRDRCFSSGRVPCPSIPADRVNPVMDEGLTNLCLDFLSALQRHPKGSSFLKAVLQTTPSYHKVIPHPRDLGLIEYNLRNRQYQTLLDFEADVRLTFENCIFFNQEWLDIHAWGREMLAYVEENWPPLDGKEYPTPVFVAPENQKKRGGRKKKVDEPQNGPKDGSEEVAADSAPAEAPPPPVVKPVTALKLKLSTNPSSASVAAPQPSLQSPPQPAQVPADPTLAPPVEVDSGMPPSDMSVTEADESAAAAGEDGGEGKKKRKKKKDKDWGDTAGGDEGEGRKKKKKKKDKKHMEGDGGEEAFTASEGETENGTGKSGQPAAPLDAAAPPPVIPKLKITFGLKPPSAN